LLIREPQLSKRMAALLGASNQPGYFVAAGKDLHGFHCAKCVYLGEDADHQNLGPYAIHVHLARNGRTPAQPFPSDRVTQELQNRLFCYRLFNHEKVRASKFQVTGFLPEFCALAQALGAPLVDEPALQAGIIELLKQRDQQTRDDRRSGLPGMVLRAVLFHCHEGSQPEVLVSAIADTVNRLCREEGESLEVSSESVGHTLKKIGLYSRRLGNAGRGLVLDKGTQLLAHELGYSHQALSDQGGVPACGHCHKLQVAQSQEVV